MENKKLIELKQQSEKVDEKKEKQEQETIESMLKEEAPTEEIDPIKTYTLEITAPLSKQQALRKFLELNKMKFRKVENHE